MTTASDEMNNKLIAGILGAVLFLIVGWLFILGVIETTVSGAAAGTRAPGLAGIAGFPASQCTQAACTKCRNLGAAFGWRGCGGAGD